MAPPADQDNAYPEKHLAGILFGLEQLLPGAELRLPGPSDGVVARSFAQPPLAAHGMLA